MTVDFDRVKSLADIVRSGAERWGEAPALWMDGEATSYAGLDRRASKVANGLIDAGIRPDDRIGFLGKNSDSYFEILFGCAKARAVLVGVNNRLAPPEIAYILNDARAKVLFVGADFAPMIEQLRAELTTVETIIAVDGGHTDWPAFDTWRFNQRDSDPMLPHAPGDDVIQLYTSGTTGHPKGVQLTNANYIAVLEIGAQAGWGDWQAEQVNIVCMPLFHVAGVNIGVIGLAHGCKNVVLKDVDPTVILDLIEQQRIEIMFVVPAVINMLVLHPNSAGRDFSSLKQVIYGASPIAEDLIVKAKAMFGCDFIQVYGMTETTGTGTYLPPEDHDPARGKLRSCGIAGGGAEVKIVDDEGNTLPPHEVGEILLRSGAIMKGYWNRPDATQSSVQDGWMSTGDAGYLDEEGYVFIFDRVKDMIVSGGENIYPAEVENALFAHPAIADVAVIGVPDEKWGEAVKAIVVLKPGESATEDDIRAFARERIAGYKVPKSVEFVEVLPRNPSGKVLRRQLREPYWEGVDRKVN